MKSNETERKKQIWETPKIEVLDFKKTKGGVTTATPEAGGYDS